MARYLQLSLDLGDPELAFLEVALQQLGALSVSPEPAADDFVVEPAPGSTPLW